MFEFLIRFLVDQIGKDAFKEVAEKAVIKTVLNHPVIKNAIRAYKLYKKAGNVTHKITNFNKIIEKQFQKAVKTTPGINKLINEVANLRRFKKSLLRKTNLESLIINKVNQYGVKYTHNLIDDIFKNNADENFKEAENRETNLTDEEIDKIEINSSTLESSWLSYGVWYPQEVQESSSEGLRYIEGSLLLSIKAGSTINKAGKHVAAVRSYTYYSVPLNTWNLMKASAGHAGTEFWRTYLRGIYKAANARGYSGRAGSDLVTRGQNFKYTVNNQYGFQTTIKRKKKNNLYRTTYKYQAYNKYNKP